MRLPQSEDLHKGSLILGLAILVSRDAGDAQVGGVQKVSRQVDPPAGC
jgi:hypothetical protein